MKKLNALTEKLINYLEKGEELVGSELPQYVEQLLTAELFSSYMELSLTVLSALGVILGCILISYFMKKYYECATNISVITTLFIGLFLLLCLCRLPSNIKRIYLIKNAPKVFLVEHLRGALK
jgi:hypothetical protein